MSVAGGPRVARYKARGRAAWLEVLGQVCRRFNWVCHTWCQMSNHYHLLLETPEANLAAGMRQLNGVYTQRFNRAHGRVGHVLQGRYKAILIEKTAYLLEACRYVVLNPVRAGLADNPADWRWSSYRGMIGLAKPPDFLSTEWLLGQFCGDPRRARELYAAFIADGVGGGDLGRPGRGRGSGERGVCAGAGWFGAVRRGLWGDPACTKAGGPARFSGNIVGPGKQA